MSDKKLSDLSRLSSLVAVERTIVLWMLLLGFARPAGATDDGVAPVVATALVHDLIDQQACPSESTTTTPLERLWERVALEPDVLTVQSWAVMQARAQPERAGQLLRDARARGALPMLRLRGRFEDESGTKWDELDLIDSRDRDSQYTLDLWLEWDLAELASSTYTLRSVREGRELVELRQGVINQVNIAYFDRQRLLAEGVLRAGDSAPRESVLRRLRIEELIATLDGLTGGRYSAALAALPAPPPSPSSRDRVASEPCRDHPGEDPDSGLRVPVHPAHRPARP